MNPQGKLLMERKMTARLGGATATVRAIQEPTGKLLVVVYLPAGVSDMPEVQRRNNCDAWATVFSQMYYWAANAIGADVI